MTVNSIQNASIVFFKTSMEEDKSFKDSSKELESSNSLSSTSSVSDTPSKEDIDNTKEAMHYMDLICELYRLFEAGYRMDDPGQSSDIQLIFKKLLEAVKQPNLASIVGQGMVDLGEKVLNDVQHGMSGDLEKTFNDPEKGAAVLMLGYLEKNKSTLNYMLENMGDPTTVPPTFSDDDMLFLGDFTIVMMTLDTSNVPNVKDSIEKDFFGYMNAPGADMIAQILMMHTYIEFGKQHWSSDTMWEYQSLINSMTKGVDHESPFMKNLISSIENTKYPENPPSQDDLAADFQKLKQAMMHFING